MMLDRPPPWSFRLLLGLVLLTPWANGGSDTVTQVLLFGGVACLATLTLVTHWRRRQSWLLSWPAAASWGGLFLGLFQLLPCWTLPTEQSPSVWVPRTVALRAALVDRPAADHSSDSIQMQRVPLTIDPQVTQQTLALLSSCLVILIVTSLAFQQHSLLRVSLWGLAGSGAALTLFAAIAKATWNGRLYWTIPLGHPQGVFGPMVYHNQAGGVLLVTLAAAGCLLALIVHDDRTGQGARRARRNRSSGILLAATPHQEWRRWCTPLRLLALSLLVVNGGGLLLTLSRGALLAAIFTAIIALFVVQPRANLRSLLFLVALTLFGAIGSVVYFRMSDAVSQRYGTLFKSEKLLEDSRLSHWGDGCAAGQDHWWWGAGMGAYRHAHQRFQVSEVERAFLNAHNQYLETWVDAGVPGLLLLGLAIGSVLLATIWLLRRSTADSWCVGLFGLFVTLATALHATVDYVLYLPANAFLMAFVIGMVMGTCWRDRTSRTGKDRADRRRIDAFGITVPHAVMVGMLLGLALCSMVVTSAAVRWNQEEQAVLNVAWGEEQRELNATVLQGLIDRLERLDSRSQDYRVSLSLGELLITQFRQQATEGLATENEMPPEAAAAFWNWTSPVVLLQRAYELSSSDGIEHIEEEILGETLITEQLGKARAAFLRARARSPLVAQNHLRLGELSFLDGHLDAAVTHLQRAEFAQPGSSDLLYELGRRYLAIGEKQAGLAAWRRSLELSTRHWSSIYDVVGKQLTGKQIDDLVLPDNPELLLMVAVGQYTEPEQLAARQALLQRIQRLAAQPVNDARQAARLRQIQGEALLLQDDVEAAVDAFALALRYAPADHELRARRAALLVRQDRLDEARREAQYAARLQPRNHQYRSLVKEIADRIASGPANRAQTSGQGYRP